MSTMRAVVIDPNAPGHLALGTADTPTPAPSQALVRVSASSLNAGEIRMAQQAEAGGKIGWDLVGTVEQPAADGSGPKQGTRVVGLVRTGAWAEFVAVPVDFLAEVPDGVSDAQAATLPVAALTALHSIERGGNLVGQNALVTGANGGVGIFACQFGKLAGARVVAAIRKESYREMVTAAGADEVVVTEDGTGLEAFAPYKVVSDGVAGRLLEYAVGLLAPDGVCAVYGAASGDSDICFNIWSLIGSRRASLYGLTLWAEFGREPAAMGLARVAGLVARGKIEPKISVEESWEKIGQVTADFLARKIPGKAVIRM